MLKKAHIEGEKMELTIASIVVDVAISIGGWLKQGAAAKKDRKTLELVASLQSLSLDGAGSPLSSAALAGAMKGAMTVPLAKPVIDTEAFKGLVREIFLCELTSANESKTEAIRASLRGLFRKHLEGQVKSEHLKQFSDHVFKSVRETSGEWVQNLRSRHPEALSALSTMASSRRLTATLEAIELHLESIQYFDRRPDAREARRLWIEKYLPQVTHAHGFIQPPDFNNSRKISIDNLYVAPKFTENSGDSQNDHDFESIIQRIDRTVILGDPGGGKSTFSAVLATHVVKQDNPRFIPFHVTLRDFAKHHEEISIVDFINMQLSYRYQCSAPDRCVESLLLSGEALVIFDGLDELIDNTKRRLVTSQVEAFGIAYPLTRILVTSRRVGYAEAKLDPATFCTFEIGDFDDGEVRSFVTKWFASQGEEDFPNSEPRELAESFILQSEAVPDLRRNPLMLSLMCIIFKGENFIPRSRPEVYKRCANLLFEKWDGHRSIEVPLRAKDHIDPAMKFFAYWVLTSNQAESGVPYSTLVSKMTEYLHPRAYNDPDEARRASEEFIDFCKGRAWVFSDAGTTSTGESLWKFTHRTFMEYFAAAHLNRIHETPERLARELLPHVAAQEWDVIAQLAVQIANERENGSERVLAVMLDERRRRSPHNRSNVLSFITRCLDFAVVSESFVERLTDVCIAQMYSLNDKPFRLWSTMTTSPLSTLLVSGGRYMRPIQDRIAMVLSNGLAAGEEVTRLRSAYMMLWWPYSYSDLGGRYSESHHSGWRTFFRGLARDNLARLVPEANIDPALNVLIILSGVEDAHLAYERALSGGLTTGEILFSTKSVWWHEANPSVWGFIFRGVFMHESQEQSAHEDLERVAAFFTSAAREFLGSGKTFTQESDFHGPFFVPTVNDLPKFVQTNSTILEAAMICLLAIFENMKGARFTLDMIGPLKESDPIAALYLNRNESSPVPLSPWFEQYVESDWLRSFISEWAVGQRSIYALS